MRRSPTCNSLLPPLPSVWVWCCLQSRLLQPPPPPGSLIAPPRPPIMHTHKVTGAYASTFTNDLVQSHNATSQASQSMYHHGNWTYPIWHKQQRWSFHYSTRFHLPHHHCTHVLQTHHETQGDITWHSFSLIKCCSVISRLQWHAITTKMHLMSMWTRSWSTYILIRHRPWIVSDLK